MVPVPERDGGEKVDQRIFQEEMIDNFPELMNNANPHVQEAKQIPSRINKNKYTIRHIIMKLPNIKDKEKHHKRNQIKRLIIFKRCLTSLTTDF